MLKKYTGGKIPEKTPENDDSVRVNRIIADMHPHFHKNMNFFQFSRALENIFQVIDDLNRMIEENKPWEMSKNNTENLPGFLRLLMGGIGLSMKYLAPFLPGKYRDFEEITGLKSDFEFPKSIYEIHYNTSLPESWPILFPRLVLIENQ
jgi:methionyl-tRNA synthetase